MTVQAFLENYRNLQMESQALEGYLRGGSTGGPGGVRTAVRQDTRNTNNPTSAAAQREDFCRQELRQRTARLEASEPLLDELLGSLGIREALVLRAYYSGCSTESVAMQLNISPATVSRSKSKALSQLAAQWGDVDLPPAEPVRGKGESAPATF